MATSTATQPTTTMRTAPAPVRRRGIGLLAAVLIVIPLLVAGGVLFANSLRSDPRAALALEAAAGLYDAGQFPLAAQAIEQIVEQGADAPPVYFDLGIASLEAGEYERAVDALERAVAGEPRNAIFAETLDRARTQLAQQVTAADATAVPQPTNAARVGLAWLRVLNANEMALVALAAWSLLAGFVCLALRKPRLRLAAYIGAALAAIVLLVAGGALIV